MEYSYDKNQQGDKTMNISFFNRISLYGLSYNLMKITPLNER